MDLKLYVEQATLSEPSIASDELVQNIRSKISIWQPGIIYKGTQSCSMLSQYAAIFPLDSGVNIPLQNFLYFYQLTNWRLTLIL